jgi:hypothetical protein
MLKTRRGFLIGVAGLLTAAFVTDARSFARRTGAPLLASPPRTAHTLYWQDIDDELVLGLDGLPDCLPQVPPLTWRQFLDSEGAKSYSSEKMEGMLEGLEPDQLDDEMDEERWLWAFSCVSGPVAKANKLLGKIDLGPALNAGRSGPHR